MILPTAIDAADIVFDYLNDPTLTAMITGQLVHQESRQPNSELEDIAVSPLQLAGSEIQDGAVYVNVYVPDVKVSGTTAKYPIPNRARLNAISKKVVELLGAREGRYFKTGNIYVEFQSNPMKVEGNVNQHMVTVRVVVRLHNTKVN